jgi:hypothetical protein
MGTLTSYVGAVDAAKSAENGSAGFSWINIKLKCKLSLCFKLTRTASIIKYYKLTTPAAQFLQRRAELD